MRSARLKVLEKEPEREVALDPSTIMHRPPTPRQQRSAESHKRGFALWEDSLVEVREVEPAPKEAKTAGDAVRAWYAERRR